MKKCTIIGKFAFEKNIVDGQTVKCITIYNELVERYGISHIEYIDTYRWKKHFLKTFKDCVKAMKYSENVVMLPAHNGVKVFGPLLSFFKKIYKTKIHYIVIGSWLLEKIQKNKILKKSLLNFDSIYVETTLLKNNLENIGFNNIYILKNYKKLPVIDLKNINSYEEKKQMKICIFSRINYEKGVEDAIKVINKINKSNIKFILDIYGPIEDSFKEKFYNFIRDSKYIYYKEIINPSKSTEVIKHYDLLLFPTRYKTEGIPGTIIDAFAAGVPVLASSWDNYKDIIDDKVNGIIYNFKDINDFEIKLENIFQNQKGLYEMKKNCIKTAKEFCSLDTLNILFQRIEDD